MVRSRYQGSIVTDEIHSRYNRYDMLYQCFETVVVSRYVLQVVIRMVVENDLNR